MLNIAVDDSDALYRTGMELLLKELFLSEQNKSVKFSLLTKTNAIQADVIVKSFVPGAEYVCQPILKFRSKPGLIIGIVDGDKKPYHDVLPLCVKDIIFIHRSEPLSTARYNVINGWNESLQKPSKVNCKKCLQCKYRTLTPQQSIIAKYFLRGNDIVDIAKLLQINVKTVSAHKRLMMSKFNLNSDCELLRFLKNLKMHNPPVHLFIDKLGL
ncbi:LuxR C-terminal-related transcriptional regulator [Buttiauxella agrestis]|uniref:Putative positive transcription regulator n=1 Tax=Buttiauxella agrestis ATCC 33320 TaxID=1006004 RepID=A0A085GC69_9ENTR|nr:LuxR C-terminal-related transcriptional regulator [Buttiauxella agrestis]KFC81314.1 putative positive transcription regulator [Buttiauxella agrestis ATCC 33320]